MKRLLLLAFPVLFVVAQAQDRAEIQLQAAIKMEVFDGNLRGAIEQYQKIINMAAANRAVKAKALLQLGGCYEKQSNAEARKTFEQLVSEFKDQTEVVAQARLRLVAIESANSSPGTLKELTISRLPLDPKVIDSPYECQPSPDGRHLSFIDPDGDLAVYDLIAGTYRNLTNKRDKDAWGTSSVWSPDGTRLIYVWQYRDGTVQHDDLRVINLDGTHQRTIYSDKDASLWDVYRVLADNKTILFAIKKAGIYQLMRLSLDSGLAETIRPLENGYPNRVEISPDGQYMTYVRRTPTDLNQRGELFISSIGGGAESQLTRGKSKIWIVGWAADGQSIFYMSDAGVSMGLWRVRVSAGKALPDPELIKSDIGDVWPIGIAATGAIFYGTGRVLFDVNTATLDFAIGKLAGSAKRINQNHIGSAGAPAWNPSGDSLAYLAATSQTEKPIGYSSLCIWSALENTEREFVLRTPVKAGPSHITWSPDGRFIFGIVQTSRNPWTEGLARIDSRTGESTVVATISGGTIISWSRDGKSIYAYKRASQKDPYILSAYDSQSSHEQELFRTKLGEVFLWNGEPCSRDGEWIVVGIRDTQNRAQRLVAIPTDGGAARDLAAGKNTFRVAYWMPDGHSLCYYQSTGDYTNPSIWRVGVGNGAPIVIASSIARLEQIAVHPDGRRVAFVSSSEENEFWVIENLPPLKSRSK